MVFEGGGMGGESCGVMQVSSWVAARVAGRVARRIENCNKINEKYLSLEC